MVTGRINARWAAEGRPGGELARRGTVVDCFKAGRRRINADLVLAVVQALHDDAGYLAQWRQMVRVVLAESQAASQVLVRDRLPDDLTDFTGRTGEVDRLLTLGGADTAGTLAVVTGMAGAGKTRLAVHAAHRLMREHPFEAVLFVDLRGFHGDPAQPPAESSAVLDAFLRLLGLPARDIPHDAPARAAAYRRRLTGRRVLVVLDNAAGSEQVRPLVADGPGCLTLVTSRRSLAALPAGVRLTAGEFSETEAAGFLSRAAPALPRGDDPAALHRIARRCGHLPLALSLVAGQMRARPGWTLTDHADRLDERHDSHRLDSGVELALSMSYRHLAPPRRMLLRRLALHPGQDIDAWAAAALVAADIGITREQLRALAAEHLVLPSGTDRYALHDLVRAYATEQARDEERPSERRAALTRLVDHYLHSAAAAMDTLYPAERHRRPRLAPRAEPLPDVAHPDAALAWLDAERPTLVAICAYCAANGWPEHGVRLAATIYSYLDNGGHPMDALAVHAAARDAARQVADVAGEAGALTGLGVVHWQLGRYDEAIEHLTWAGELFHAAGDLLGEARTTGNLGIVCAAMERWEAADGHHRRALELFRLADDRVGEANTLCNLGDVQVRLGAHEVAERHLHEALRLFRGLEHHGGAATALTNLGDVYVALARYERAAEHHREAVTLFGALGERYGEVCALNGLGEALTGLGRYADAAARHAGALTIATEIADREEQARAHAGLAEAYRSGDAPGAERHRREAAALRAELGLAPADEVHAD